MPIAAQTCAQCWASASVRQSVSLLVQRILTFSISDCRFSISGLHTNRFFCVVGCDSATWPPKSAIGNRKSKITSAQKTSQPWRQHAAEFSFHRLVNLAVGFINCRQDHVLQHFDVAFFHGFRLDPQSDNLVIAFHLHGNHATSRRSFDAQFLHLLLHLLLPCLRLLHHLLNLESTRKLHRSHLSSI